MRFDTEDLLSRSGFFDGDMLDSFLSDNGFKTDKFAEHEILIWAVERYVVPKLQQFVICHTNPDSMHNPIMARKIDHVDVFECKNIKLMPEFVDVDDQIILNIAREVTSNDRQ